MEVIPAIDLLNQQIVRLKQGKYEDYTVYYKNPLDIIQTFTKFNIPKLHIINLLGSKDGQLHDTDILQKIKNQSNMAIQFGGGIRSYNTVETLFQTYLNPKIDHVLIGSLPFLNPSEFNKIVSQYKDNIILTLDVWGEDIKISGWTESTHTPILDYIQKIQNEFGIENFLVTQIQRDGMLEGPDVNLYKKILREFPNISLIASGGVSSVNDLHQLSDIHVAGAILGKAFYDKKIQLEEIQSFFS